MDQSAMMSVDLPTAAELNTADQCLLGPTKSGTRRHPVEPSAHPTIRPVDGCSASDALRWHLGCPLRPVDWRWRSRDYRVIDCYNVDDTWERRRIRVIYEPGCQLNRLDPDRRLAVLAAAAIRADGTGIVPLRDQLEALILTDMLPVEISNRLDIPVDVVVGYERYFFAVRDRLSESTYVRIHAIGMRADSVFSEDDPGTLLRYYAYFGGLMLYDAVLEYLLHRDDFDRWVDDEKDDEQRLLRLNVRRMVRARCLGQISDLEAGAMILLALIAVDRWAIEQPPPKIPGLEDADAQRIEELTAPPVDLGAVLGVDMQPIDQPAATTATSAA